MTGIPLNFYNSLDLLPALIVIPSDEPTHLIQSQWSVLPLVKELLGGGSRSAAPLRVCREGWLRDSVLQWLA